MTDLSNFGGKEANFVGLMKGLRATPSGNDTTRLRWTCTRGVTKERMISFQRGDTRRNWTTSASSWTCCSIAWTI